MALRRSVMNSWILVAGQLECAAIRPATMIPVGAYGDSAKDCAIAHHGSTSGHKRDGRPAGGWPFAIATAHAAVRCFPGNPSIRVRNAARRNLIGIIPHCRGSYAWRDGEAIELAVATEQRETASVMR